MVNITVENDIMSTFILLLIHDIRHDFNYNIWTPTLINFMNTNTDLIKLKEEWARSMKLRDLLPWQEQQQEQDLDL